jgi:hypothetical protein
VAQRLHFNAAAFMDGLNGNTATLKNEPCATNSSFLPLASALLMPLRDHRTYVCRRARLEQGGSSLNTSNSYLYSSDG